MSKVFSERNLPEMHPVERSLLNTCAGIITSVSPLLDQSGLRELATRTYEKMLPLNSETDSDYLRLLNLQDSLSQARRSSLLKLNVVERRFCGYNPITIEQVDRSLGEFAAGSETSLNLQRQEPRVYQGSGWGDWCQMHISKTSPAGQFEIRYNEYMSDSWSFSHFQGIQAAFEKSKIYLIPYLGNFAVEPPTVERIRELKDYPKDAQFIMALGRMHDYGGTEIKFTLPVKDFAELRERVALIIRSVLATPRENCLIHNAEEVLKSGQPAISGVLTENDGLCQADTVWIYRHKMYSSAGSNILHARIGQSAETVTKLLLSKQIQPSDYTGRYLRDEDILKIGEHLTAQKIALLVVEQTAFLADQADHLRISKLLGIPLIVISQLSSSAKVVFSPNAKQLPVGTNLETKAFGHLTPADIKSFSSVLD